MCVHTAQSPHSFNLGGSSRASPCNSNLKSVNEMQKQLVELEKQNFNLMLRIYYLEEQKGPCNEGERDINKQIVNLQVSKWL